MIDRTGGLGGQGAPLWMEVKAALENKECVNDYVAGLAGRDVSIQTIEKVYLDILKGKQREFPLWIDCDREHAMDIREVLVND